jgi:hypothetical protein
MVKYTKEQLIFYIKKLAVELKRTPTIKDVNKAKSIPSSNTYYKRFKTWNSALKAACLKINVKQGYNKEELLENLAILGKELQRSPRPKDLKGKQWAGSYATYKKYFGKWKNAIRQANLQFADTTQNLKDYSKKK